MKKAAPQQFRLNHADYIGLKKLHNWLRKHFSTFMLLWRNVSNIYTFPFNFLLIQRLKMSLLRFPLRHGKHRESSPLSCSRQQEVMWLNNASVFVPCCVCANRNITHSHANRVWCCKSLDRLAPGAGFKDVLRLRASAGSSTRPENTPAAPAAT